MRRSFLVVCGLALVATLSYSPALADSTCAVGGGPVSAGTTGDGAQACLNVSGYGGTMTVTSGYVAYDGRAVNPEPLDGYIAADTTGVYFCASGEFDPRGGNMPIAHSLLGGPCRPQIGY